MSVSDGRSSARTFRDRERAETIASTPDALDMAENRGVRPARLAAIKADIAANIARPDLSAGTIAQRHGVSRRYIHRLFEHSDCSFAEFVLEQVANLSQTTVVRDAWTRGQALAVHGWIYDLSDGLLRDLEVSISALPG